jgi:hypothetical protein
MGVGVKFWDFS